MGWYGSFARTKTERINEVLKECTWKNENTTSQLISKRTSPSGVWTLQKIQYKDSEPEYVLCVHMMHLSDGQWMVKSISLCAGPGDIDCPASLVDQWYKLCNGVMPNEYASNWYDKWKKQNEVNIKSKSLKENDKLIVYGNEVHFVKWYNKSKSKFVGIREGRQFWYHTKGITEIF